LPERTRTFSVPERRRGRSLDGDDCRVSQEHFSARLL